VYLLLILTLVFSLVRQPAPREAVIVWVDQPGVSWDASARDVARADIDAALAWWQRQDVGSIPLVTAERTITVDDPFDTPGWMRPYVTWESATLEIYMVANPRGQRLLHGRYLGMAADGYHAMFAVGGTPYTAAIVAHELGHVLFGLDDLPLTTPDLMGNAIGAYRAGGIGCQSRAALGQPCTPRVWLPVVAQP